MRRFLVIVLAAMALAASCAPQEGDGCGDEGRVVCGARSSLLLCSDGTLKQHGGCYGTDESCNADPTGDNDAWCDDLPNTYGIGIEGTDCEQNGSWVCDADDDAFVLKCIEGTWVRRTECPDSACGLTEFATVGCLDGDGVSAS